MQCQRTAHCALCTVHNLREMEYNQKDTQPRGLSNRVDFTIDNAMEKDGEDEFAVSRLLIVVAGWRLDEQGNDLHSWGWII